jgi:hypothetical protein
MFQLQGAGKLNPCWILEQIETYASALLSDYTELAGKLNINFMEVIHFIINLIDPMMYR